ncbi:MAG TPA: HAD hydrolase family protein, partial [Candidatus Babeliales bacterium]|nr:HAD hydrolase family protein [Candidatus Babeliales bacterium]
MFMIKKIKALLLDIDGVILNTEYDTNVKLWDALNFLRENGFVVSFLTSRPFAMSTYILDSFESEGIHVFDNGAYIKDTNNNIIIENQTLEGSMVRNILNYLEKNDPGSKYGISSNDVFLGNVNFVRNLNNYM